MIEVYCDESRQDLICSHVDRTGYLLIGGLWLPAELRSHVKKSIAELKAANNREQELKWQRVSRSAVEYYKAVIDLFLSLEELRFRCILVDAARVDLERFHGGDQELGFYKFYYQLLNNWISDDETYRVFCDMKTNRERSRLPVLMRVLNNSHMYSPIESVQALPSHESTPTQLADFLLGAASARLNADINPSGPKMEVIRHLEAGLGVPRLGPTSWSERKFNIFAMRLR